MASNIADLKDRAAGLASRDKATAFALRLLAAHQPMAHHTPGAELVCGLVDVREVVLALAKKTKGKTASLFSDTGALAAFVHSQPMQVAIASDTKAVFDAAVCGLLLPEVQHREGALE